MANGAQVTGLNPDYYLNLKGNQNLQVGNIIIYVDASIARNIYLPSILKSDAKFGVAQNHVYIFVFGTSAVNVYPYSGEQINGGATDAPILIQNTSNGYTVTDIMPVANTKTGNWFTPYVANNGSGGGGGVGAVQTFSITILAARVIQLLNDHSLFDVVIPAQPSGKLVQMLTANMAVRTYGGIPYNGTNPRLMIGFGGAEASLNTCYFSTSANGAEFTYDYSTAPSLPLAWGLAQNPFPAGIVTQADITISSPAGNTVTQGNSDIIICGTYSLIDI